MSPQSVHLQYVHMKSTSKTALKDSSNIWAATILFQLQVAYDHTKPV